jgi:hypothetical protein
MARFRTFSLRVAAMALAAVPALAGTPYDETLRCPIGNESVTFTSTYSCTEFGGERRMSLAPVSSCDFIERLPQCPTSKLPMYRAFDKDEVKVLRTLVKTDLYARAATQSRFYLAYVIERELRPDNTETHFGLLLNGFWHDSGLTFGNGDYMKAFAEAANRFAETATPADKALVWSVGAYAHLQNGNPAKARELIRAVRANPAARETGLLRYVALVEGCLRSPAAETCRPDHEISLAE